MADTRSETPSAALLIAALGIVYGDIGTSPLYAFREGVGTVQDGGIAPAEVMGLLSMIFWIVTLVVSVKYVLIVMRAGNGGEGGILALLALVMRHMPAQGRAPAIAVALGLFGAAMFYGDSVITPAISVLSAVEGLSVVSPAFESAVVPLTLVVLVALFAIQHRGTARIGRIFGAIMVLWFLTLGVMGAVQIVRAPIVLTALEPMHALGFAAMHPALTLTIMAAVFLSVTGAEALYADMGHFGRRPIYLAWFWLVMPCLMLNYFGQGSLVLTDPNAARNPFFLLAPPVLQLPLVVLATAATVIASQAVISGAFSITSQAINLGYMPRMAVHYTSDTTFGQVYVPFVNWLLLVLVALLVVGFGTSSSLAGAYGVAVATTMVITMLGVIVVAHHRWCWSPARMLLVLVPLLLLDLMLLTANAAKIPHGGWLPLAFGGLLYALMSTWRRGRAMVNHERSRAGLALAPFITSLTTYPPQRVEGTAVFLSAIPDEVPAALLHNLKHNRVLHERVVFLTALPQDVPHIDATQAADIRELGDGCYSVKIKLGFKDSYDIADIAKLLGRIYEFDLDANSTSFFLSRESIVTGRRRGMKAWRDLVFAWMSRSAQPASDYFRIPPNRVIEIGTQIVI